MESNMPQKKKVLEPSFQRTCDLIYNLASTRISQKFEKWQDEQPNNSTIDYFYPTDRKLFGNLLKGKRGKENWYRDKAKEKINERIRYYQTQFDVKPKKIVIKDQEKCWGSCTKDNQLLFNWKCIMAPSPVLDYIVVHEMCHMVHMNHSKEFWHLLRMVLPDYEQRKSWLRDNGVKYDL